MKISIAFTSRIVLRSLPLIATAVVSSMQPVLAAVTQATGPLAVVQTQTTQVQNSMLGVAFAGCVIGIGLGSWHYMQHRDDWVGASGRLVAGIVGGVIVAQAVPLASLAGGATF